MKELLGNYHSHTSRCGHASGTMEDYVIEAIKAGYNILGFSDHVPFPKGLEVPGVRMKIEELDSYFEEFYYLKEKYRDQIELHIGFECEAIPTFYDFYKEELISRGAEYLILGHHQTIDDNNYLVWSKGNTPLEVMWNRVNEMIEGMKSGLFSYICHPDMYINGYMKWDYQAKKACKKLIEASIKYDVPLEINEQGLFNNRRKSHYHYPFLPFWKMVGKSNAKVIIGVDAHNAISFLHPNLNKCYSIAKKSGIIPIRTVEFKNIIRSKRSSTPF